MPRPTANQTAESPTPVADVPTASRNRARRAAPDGVTLGLIAPVKAELPKRTGGPGKGVSQETLAAIALLEANKGDWYLIGVFGSATSAVGVWKDHGVVFKNRKREDGMFDRYASIPVAEVTAD